jgi:vacuolar-type H+-ATPase subunit F/Vma7
MPAPAYIGDEISAAGYRLAGAQVTVPGDGAASAALEVARASSPLVLISAAVAAGIDAAQLRAAMMALQPLVLIVPDVQGEARLRGQLGMEA